MDASEFDPFSAGSNQPPPQATSSTTNVSTQAIADASRAKQDAFIRLAETFHKLWWKLPEMSLRDVDAELQKVFDSYLALASKAGVSTMGIPDLRECCGKRRPPWPDEAPPAAAAKEAELGWGPGDLIRRATKALGIKHCDGCETRRQWLNDLFGKGSQSQKSPRSDK